MPKKQKLHVGHCEVADVDSDRHGRTKQTAALCGAYAGILGVKEGWDWLFIFLQDALLK
jgi:hypothetical protein